jgi:hypothetical protein
MRDNPRPITNDGTLRNPNAEKDKKLKSFKVIMLSFVTFLMMVVFSFYISYPLDFLLSTFVPQGIPLEYRYA